MATSMKESKVSKTSASIAICAQCAATLSVQSFCNAELQKNAESMQVNLRFVRLACIPHCYRLPLTKHCESCLNAQKIHY